MAKNSQTYVIFVISEDPWSTLIALFGNTTHQISILNCTLNLSFISGGCHYNECHYILCAAYIWIKSDKLECNCYCLGLKRSQVDKYMYTEHFIRTTKPHTLVELVYNKSSLWRIEVINLSYDIDSTSTSYINRPCMDVQLFFKGNLRRCYSFTIQPNGYIYRQIFKSNYTTTWRGRGV